MATIALTPGRVPPHDLDAETSVLGSILLDPLSIAKVLQFLHPEDFYRENNGQVYRAALDLFAAGEPIDNVTLAAQLQTLGMLDRVGGGEAEEAINQAQSLVCGGGDERGHRALSKLYDLLGPAIGRTSLQTGSG